MKHQKHLALNPEQKQLVTKLAGTMPITDIVVEVESTYYYVNEFIKEKALPTFKQTSKKGVNRHLPKKPLYSRPVPPDDPKKMQRPPATYSNVKSLYNLD